MLSPTLTGSMTLNELFNFSDLEIHRLYKGTQLADLQGGLNNILM